VPYKKPIIEKMFYSMRETSELLDVNQSTLRFWENEFDILKPHKNAKGTRHFRPEDIKNLRLIHYLLKEKGLTIKGAKKKLDENPQGTLKTFEVVSKLTSIKDELLRLKDALSESDDEI
jgi:DNA-binding transcriptional MerR regulator